MSPLPRRKVGIASAADALLEVREESGVVAFAKPRPQSAAFAPLDWGHSGSGSR